MRRLIRNWDRMRRRDEDEVDSLNREIGPDGCYEVAEGGLTRGQNRKRIWPGRRLPAGQPLDRRRAEQPLFLLLSRW